MDLAQGRADSADTSRQRSMHRLVRKGPSIKEI